MDTNTEIPKFTPEWAERVRRELDEDRAARKEKLRQEKLQKQKQLARLKPELEAAVAKAQELAAVVDKIEQGLRVIELIERGGEKESEQS